MELTKDIDFLKKKIRTVPDFPQKGILFRDVFPIFQEPQALEVLITHMTYHLTSTIDSKIDVIVGLDARGFLFGPLLAMRLGASFVPVRKRGKLCGETITAEYTKEYGVDVFEMQKDSIKPGQNVVIVDDLIATGGSAYASGELVKKSGGNIVEFMFVIELLELEGSKKLQGPTYSVLKY